MHFLLLARCLKKYYLVGGTEITAEVLAATTVCGIEGLVEPSTPPLMSERGCCARRAMKQDTYRRHRTTALVTLGFGLGKVGKETTA